MKTGIMDSCFPADLSLEKRFVLARDAGYDGIELGGTVEELASEEGLRIVAELAKRTGVAVPSLAGGIGGRAMLGSPDPAERAQAVLGFKRSVKAAHFLGADTILVYPARVSEQVSQDAAWEWCQAGLRELGTYAEEFGVFLGVENVWNKFILTPLEMRRFVDEVGHPLVQVYFDVGNVLTSGYPEQWIDILGSRIKKVHVKDFRAPVGNYAGFVTLLEGDVNWPAVMAALRRIGYDGYITAEVPPFRYLPDKGIRDLATSIKAIVGL